MRTRFCLGLGAAVLVATTASAAAPIEGMWHTPVHNGIIEIAPCGVAECGRVVTSDKLKADPNMKDANNKDPSLRDRPIHGLTLLNGFAGGPKEYKGGTAYNPEDGATYHGSLTLIDPNTLKVTGCIIFPLCRTQTWTRVN